MTPPPFAAAFCRHQYYLIPGWLVGTDQIVVYDFVAHNVLQTAAKIQPAPVNEAYRTPEFPEIAPTTTQSCAVPMRVPQPPQNVA